MEQKRFAYVLKDVNSLNTQELIPNEILLDYDNIDLVIVDKLGKTFSFKKYILGELKTKLSVDHSSLSNQHAIVNIDDMLPGFMAPSDLITLKNLDTMIKEYSQMLDNNRMNSKFNVVRLEYAVNKRILDISCVFNNAGALINVDGNIDMFERPIRGFINIDNTAGYRYDLVYVEVTPDECVMKFLSNVIYSDDKIITSDAELMYDVDRGVYNIDGVSSLIPVLLIERRNDEIVSEYNIHGKYSENYISKEEITDISRRSLPNVSYGRIIETMSDVLDKNMSYGGDTTKIIKSNLSYEIGDDAITFIPFNGDDADTISGSILNKKCVFKVSPFGKMMLYSNSEGDAISLNHSNSDFKIDMILDICGYRNIFKQKMFTIYNALVSEPILEFSYLGNGKFKIEYTKDKVFNTFDITGIDETYNRYTSVVIHVTKYSVDVLLNGKVVSSISTTIDIYSMANFKINDISFPIGSVLISNNTMDLSNAYINDNVILMEKFDIASKETIMEHKSVYFTPKNASIISDAKVTIYTDGVQSDQIKEGSLIEFDFNKELMYGINPISHIIGIDGNKITLFNDKFVNLCDSGIFNKGDSIIISKDINGVMTRLIFEILYMVEDSLILDGDVDILCMDYHVSNMCNTNYIKLTDSGSNSIGSIGIRDNKVKVISRRAYSSSSIFKLEYIEKKQSSDIIDCIKDIENVSFNNVKVEAMVDNIIKEVKMIDMTMVLDGDRIPKAPKNIAVFNNNDINMGLTYDISKCINEISKTMLDNVIDITCSIIIANGNNVLHVNGEMIQNDNSMRRINIPVEYDSSGIIRLDILSEKADIVNEINKIVIENISIIIKFKERFKKVFIGRDVSGKVINYLLLSESGIFSNVSPLTMAISAKIDSFEINKNVVYLSEVINGYRMIMDNNNIVKLLQVDSGKIYRLEKYYIL